MSAENDEDYWPGCNRPRPHTFHAFRDGGGRGRECGIGRFDRRPGKWDEARAAEIERGEYPIPPGSGAPSERDA